MKERSCRPAAGSSTDHIREIFAKVKSVLYTRVSSIVMEHLAGTVEMLCEMAADEEKLRLFLGQLCRVKSSYHQRCQLLINPLV